MMRFPLPHLALATMILLVSACGPAPTDPGPGGVSAADAEALDKAAEKLDERDKSAEQDDDN